MLRSQTVPDSSAPDQGERARVPLQCSGPASAVRILDDHSHEPDQGALPEEALPERGAVPLCEGGAVSPASHSGSGTGAPDRSLLDGPGMASKVKAERAEKVQTVKQEKLQSPVRRKTIKKEKPVSPSQRRRTMMEAMASTVSMQVVGVSSCFSMQTQPSAAPAEEPTSAPAVEPAIRAAEPPVVPELLPPAFCPCNIPGQGDLWQPEHYDLVSGVLLPGMSYPSENWSDWDVAAAAT